MADVHDFDLAIFGENHQVVGNCDEVARGDSPLSSLKVKGGITTTSPLLGLWAWADFWDSYCIVYKSII